MFRSIIAASVMLSTPVLANSYSYTYETMVSNGNADVMRGASGLKMRVHDRVIGNCFFGKDELIGLGNAINVVQPPKDDAYNLALDVHLEGRRINAGMCAVSYSLRLSFITLTKFEWPETYTLLVDHTLYDNHQLITHHPDDSTTAVINILAEQLSIIRNLIALANAKEK